jgi:hypothetical protein
MKKLKEVQLTKSLLATPSWRFRRSLICAAVLGAGLVLAGCSTTPTDSVSGAMTASSTSPSAASTAKPTAAAPERDQAVIDRLKQMSAYLRALKSFQVTSQTTIDQVLDTGQKVQFGGVTGYRYVAPDKLRAFVRNDRTWRDFYGKTLTQVAPRMNYYASVPASGPVGAVLDKVSDEYNIELPLADLFTWGSEDSVNSVTSAILVGPANIDGADCDHFALRQDGADWQVWVQRGAQPLPRKMVITTTDEAQQPQYTALLKWYTTIRPGATEFTYSPTKGAMRITQSPIATAAQPQSPK